MDSKPPTLEPDSYICAACGEETKLRPGDTIQCKLCTYKILYKKRTRRIIEHQAR